MKEEVTVVYVEDPEASAWGIIGRGLGSYNDQQAGGSGFQRLCYALQNAEKELVGGVMCELYWQWLHVDLLWVPEPLRGQGYGRELMAAAETEAKRRGAAGAYLDTFSFQAPGFYEKLGYEVFGELSDFPPGHRRYFLRKAL